MSTSQASLRYVLRIVRVLSDNHRIGISDLALLTRINHQRCLTNVLWLKQMGLVEIDSVDNRKEVVVTESGVDFIMKLETLLSPLETLEEKRTLYGQDPMKDVASPNAPKIH